MRLGQPGRESEGGCCPVDALGWAGLELTVFARNGDLGEKVPAVTRELCVL